MTSQKNPFLGTWRIAEMEHWDLDFIDAEEEGTIEFGEGGQGDFQFGYVHESMDYEIEKVDGKHRIVFSWDGQDELDPVSGRDWAVIESDESLYGKLAFHMGEKSWFKAKRKTASS
jgi:uncharacterized protein YndB with AHSA1/START domain